MNRSTGKKQKLIVAGATYGIIGTIISYRATKRFDENVNQTTPLHQITRSVMPWVVGLIWPFFLINVTDDFQTYTKIADEQIKLANKEEEKQARLLEHKEKYKNIFK
jgi:hypothetical protein